MDSLELSIRLCREYPGNWFEVYKYHDVGELHSFQAVWGRAPELEEMVEYLTSVGGDVYRTTKNIDVQKSLLVNFHVSVNFDENAKGDLCEQQQQQPQLRDYVPLKKVEKKPSTWHLVKGLNFWRKKWGRYLLGIKTWLSTGSDMSQ